MVSAADFAKSRGEADSADFLLAYADWLVVHLEEWMVTTCGELVDGLPRHYIRINPTDAQTPDPHTDLGSGPQVTDADVAVTWSYQGKRRMMLNYPILNRSLGVTGSEKAGMLIRLRDGDPSIPAGRVRQERALVFADRDAAKHIETA